MLHRLVTFVLLLLPMAVAGQASPEKLPWDIGCDTLDTQMEMNVCSYDAFMIADSVLAQKYDQLVLYFDTYYNKEIQATSEPATELEKKYLATLESQKASVLASHEGFIIYRDHMVQIMGEYYAGGTIRPLIENMYALELTVNQLNVLTKMMQEIMPEQ